MRKPKLLALLIALAFVCSLGVVACKNGGEPQEPPTLYTVTFVTNGGSALPEQGVYDGYKAIEPGDPVRGGYDLAAWYKDEALTAAWNFDADKVTGDLTLYAKWQLKTASEDGIFAYGETGDTYIIAKKLGVTLPSDLVLPSEHNGRAVTGIADYAFENEKTVRCITVPDSITEIGRQAFRNCEALEVINEAKNVERIGSNAFYGTAWALSLTGGDVYLGKSYYTYAGGMYTDTQVTVKEGTVGIAAGAFDSKENLTAVTLPATLKYIDDYAFGGVQKGTGLTAVELPAGLVRIGNNAFRNAGLTAVTIGEKVEYVGNAAFAGCPVAALNYNAMDAAFGSIAAFNNCETKAAVTIGDEVTVFPTDLFKNWTGVESVDVGDGVTALPAYAFDRRSGITRVTLGAGLTAIGNYALRGTGVSEIVLPENLTSIGYGALANCASLTKIILNATNLTSAPGSNALAFADCPSVTEIAIGENAAVVPADLFSGLPTVTALTLGGVKTIGDRAFKGVGVTSLTIPAETSTIGEEAFSGLAALAELNLGGAKTIGARAFYGAAFTSLTIPAQVTSLGKDAFGGNAALTSVAFNAVNCEAADGATSIFGGCEALSAVTVGRGVTRIPAYFLSGNTLIESLTLPEGLTAIGDHAFDGCTQLATIEGTEGIKSLGADAFKNTSWLSSILENPGAVYVGSVLQAYTGDIPESGELVIREGTTAIAPNVFQYKSNLTSVTFPEGLIEIGAGAFQSTGLTSVTLPEGLIEIGANAFQGTKLTSVTLPESLTTLGKQAFMGCYSLETVTFGGITAIPDMAFMSCIKLGTVTFGEKIESIGDNAFSSCRALQSLSIPASVKSIGKNAFGSCREVAELTLSDGVKSIGDSAFSGLAITGIVVPASVTELGASVFLGCSSLTTAEVYASSVGDQMFKNCSKLTQVTLGDNVKSIGAEAFFGQNDSSALKLLKTIDLKNVERIGSKAFCASGLTELTLPATLKEIGSSAFDGCRGLVIDLVLPETLTKLGGQAFMNSGLKSVSIPKSIGSIPTSFRGCSNLESVTIADGITSIAGAAFMSCGKLRIVEIPASVKTIAASAFDSTKIVYLNVGADAVIDARAFHSTALFLTDDPDLYKDAPNWESFKDRIYATDAFVDDAFIIVDGALERYVGGAGDVNIPASVTSLRPGVFDGAAVSAFTVAEGNTAFTAVDGSLYTAGGTVFLLYAGGKTDTEITLPEGVTEIADKAFTNKALTAVTIGGAVTKVGANAFTGLTNLKTLDFLPAEVPALGENAIPASVRRINVPAGKGEAYRAALPAFADFILADGETPVEFLIKEGVLIWYGGAGGEVVLPDEVTEIAADAFGENATITKLTIGKNVAKIAPTALNKLTGLKHVVYNAISAADMSSQTDFMGGVETLEIGAEVEVIPAYMFYRNKSISSVTVPASVKRIGMYAFGAAHSATPYNALTTLVLNEGLQTIDVNFISNQAGLTELTLPSTLTNVNSYAFGSVKIKKITVLGQTAINFTPMSSTLEEVVLSENYPLQSSAFSNFSRLQKATLPAKLKVIPMSVFNNCSALTTVVWPEAFTGIGMSAFAGCSRLTSIVLPEMLTNIDGTAFQNCSGLTGTLTLPKNLTTIGFNAFANTGYTKVIVNSVALRSNGWNFGALSPELAADATVLPGYFYSAFDGDELVVPDGIVEIGAQAFNGAKANKLVLPETVTTLVMYSFSSVGVKEIVLPNSVTSIPRRAFNYSTTLESVTFGNAVTDIATEAFRNCAAVKELIFKGETPAAIAENAFPLNEGLTIKVPAASVEAYKTAWTAYADYIVADATPAPEPDPAPVAMAARKEQAA